MIITFYAMHSYLSWFSIIGGAKRRQLFTDSIQSGLNAPNCTIHHRPKHMTQAIRDKIPHEPFLRKSADVAQPK